jgi:xanthine permease XanP
VIYRLEDRPPLGQTVVAALQHLLAIFVGIVTPTLVLSAPLELDGPTTNYLVSMALIVSGVATFIQIRKIGPVGSGLLSIQGTSFAFIGPIILNRSSNQYLRMGAIVIGIAVGYTVSAVMGLVNFSGLADLPVVNVPIPFRYGLDFDVSLFIPVAFVFVITTIESTGDLTATSMVSDEPIEGDLYIERVKGGVLGDGVNSAIAAVFNTFPNTTFSQNNGVIQLTGVASRFIGYFVAGFLVLFGLFPVVGAIVTAMPRPVLGGATIIMFGTVAAAGIKIIATGGDVNRRDILILAVSMALGLGVQLVPDALQNFPDTARSIFSSPITTGGLTAMVLNLVLPRDDAGFSVPEVEDIPSVADAPETDGFPAVTEPPETPETDGRYRQE